MKKVLFMFAVILMALTSCSNEEVTTQKEFNTETFLSEFRSNYDLFLDQPFLSSDNSNNASSRAMEMKDASVIYVDASGLDKNIDIDLTNIETTRDLIDFVRVTDAEISQFNDGTFPDSIHVSNIECINALTPLIKQSKEYLYSKGFTDKDITDMLNENNAHETSLVPFVFILAEYERSQNENMVNVLPSVSRSVNWSKVEDCALQALGVDILFAFGSSTAKTWSVAIIKRVFKNAALKIVGPVGATLAIVDFSICYLRS